MTPAEQLGRLPEPVQAELWDLARQVSGMSREERLSALEVVAAVAEAFVVHLGGTEYPTLRMFDHWGGVVRTIDEAGFPREKDVI